MNTAFNTVLNLPLVRFWCTKFLMCTLQNLVLFFFFFLDSVGKRTELSKKCPLIVWVVAYSKYHNGVNSSCLDQVVSLLSILELLLFQIYYCRQNGEFTFTQNITISSSHLPIHLNSVQQWLTFIAHSVMVISN